MLEHLKAALVDTYALEREVGQGGMSTVYLARDVRHDRAVALKVLRPELAIALGFERFQREIDVAAKLSHPHILPLYDSGEAGGFLYYIMPYVEGETLRDRLAREVQLPIEDALSITRQAAMALGYAHSRGVVHRDIKPGNIMFSGGEVVVTDFGVARALDSADPDKITSTGLAIGTPAYMSPEQATPGTPIDGRSDIYSLGCVLFEMLIGEPPFGGPSAQVIMARHSLERVPAIKAVRETVPTSIEQAVHRALAKIPADRFSTAQQFAEALSDPTAPTSVAPGKVARLTFTRRTGALFAALFVALIAVAVVAIGWPREGTRIDPNVVAILPFSSSGPIDPSLGDLSNGIPYLLHAQLTGEGGPRAVYPGTVTDALRHVLGSVTVEISDEEALRVAESLGAGQLLRGHILGTGDGVMLSASLFSVPSGRVITSVPEVSSADGLIPLVEGLTAQLLVRSAGETGQRLSVLVTHDLEALRLYFAGQQAYARGDYQQAERQFNAALDVDSLFPLAALALADAASWLALPSQSRGYALAWAGQDRLGSRDRAILHAATGPGYPYGSTRWEYLTALERAAQAAPDRKEVHYRLADHLLHWGPLLGVPRSFESAAQEFRRAIQFDTTFAAPLGHLLDIAVHNRDTAEVRHFGALYFAAGSSGQLADYYRWRRALALGDSATLARLRLRFAEFAGGALDRIVASTQLDGELMSDALRAAEARRASDLHVAYGHLRHLALNRGRLGEAEEARRTLRELAPTESPDSMLVDVIEWLFWSGDGERARRLLEPRVESVNRMLQDTAPPSQSDAYDLCAVELWRHRRLEYAGTDHAVGRLRAARLAFEMRMRVTRRDLAQRWPVNPRFPNNIALCSAILAAQAASRLQRADAAGALARLDSLARSAPWSDEAILSAANLTVARLREENGDLAGALVALKRRPYIQNVGMFALSTFLREEGRLAADTGDPEGAVRAYRHYLALRSDPDPSLVDEVAKVREALDRLIAEDR